MFEHEIELFAGGKFFVEFLYMPATFDRRDEPGTPDEVDVNRIVFNGTELDFKDVDDHLVEALESWLEDHYDDWIDDPYA